MKIIKLFPKKILQKKLENRKLKTIQEYTTISDSLDSKYIQRINENIDSIARYARRKDCHLEFVPAEDLFQNSMQLNVYKKGISILKGDDGLPIMGFNLKSLSGQSVLPQDAKGADLIGDIRKIVKGIIDNDKNWNNKFSEIKNANTKKIK